MNYIDSELLQKVNEEAIYNTYLYLAHMTTPKEHESFKSIVYELEDSFKSQNSHSLKNRDIYRLGILKDAVRNNKFLAACKISNLTRSKSGLTACTFIKPNGDISVVFKGTGRGEWIDNGEGLSGIPEENTYITYSQNGSSYSETVKNDYASEQQVEALNWFNRIAYENGWDSSVKITISGHSKGGNKAQFVAINSDIPNDCYSFDGHGFSPEALAALKSRYGDKYDERRKHILSFSADNDYVNVLGERLASQVYYFKSQAGIHYIDAILDQNGRLRPQCEQGRLSQYAETVSKDVMSLPPLIRQYATLGIMNIFQKYLGSGIPVNGDSVSTEKTIAGLGIAVGSFLHRFLKI